MELPSAVRRARARARDLLEPRLGVDRRALAALRVALGALLLLDLALRARSIRAFYTDFGVLPRSALAAQYPTFGQLSIHTLSGGLAWQVALFVVAGAFALALLVGYRTRLATVVSAILLLSLQARNPVVLNGGDTLLLHVAFWACFLPLGSRWAVDARDPETGDGRVLSAASAGLLLQVVVLYGVNAVLKLRGDSWLSGKAVRVVFSLDQFTVLLGDVLPRYPDVLVATSHVWLALLVASPLLVAFTNRLRTALAGAFVLAHAGMLLTMKLGVFPLVTVVALLPFFPSPVWDRVDAAVPERPFASLRRALPRGPTVDWGRLRYVARAVAVVALVVMLVWNAASLGLVGLPDGAPSPEENSWSMFAPEPLSTDGWYVAPGILTSGERVDAYDGSAVDFSKPPDVSATYPTARWRKYLVSIALFDDEPLRDEFAGYLCRQWNATHDSRLANVTVYFVAQPTRLGGSPDPTHRIALANRTCGGGRA